MATPIGFDPTVYQSATAAPFTSGARYTYDGKEYLFVKTSGATNPTAAKFAELAASATRGVTTTIDRGSALGRIPIGVHVGSVTVGNYCFLGVDGEFVCFSDGSANSVALKMKTSAGAAGETAAATLYTDMVAAIVTVVDGATTSYTGLVKL